MIQTTNIRRVLDRMMRHPMLRDIPFETVIEYTVDFISLLGVPALYEEKTAKIQINDWRGALPCDFVSIIQVRQAAPDNGKHEYHGGAMYRYSGDTFHMSPDKHRIEESGFTYKIQGMFIFTSIKECKIEIAYNAFAVDDEGYPLLPDNTSFLRGLEAYIKMQWFTMLFDMGKISVSVYQNAQQDYAWAVGDAQSEFSRLTIDKAESLFNSFKTLLPRTKEHSNGFLTDGAKENWYKH